MALTPLAVIQQRLQAQYSYTLLDPRAQSPWIARQYILRDLQWCVDRLEEATTFLQDIHGAHGLYSPTKEHIAVWLEGMGGKGDAA